jgi:hypothetical protein
MPRIKGGIHERSKTLVTVLLFLLKYDMGKWIAQNLSKDNITSDPKHAE